MKLTFRCARLATVLAAGWVLAPVTGAPAREDVATVRARFAKPPRQFASAPLWVWNDRLTDEQIRSTLRDLAGQHVRQAFVHPRPGLMTPYLSEEWFHLWKVALDEADRLDMNIWIYDENSYPSGFAGGWVPRLMPEARGMGLHSREVKTPPRWADNLLAVHRLEGNQAVDVTEPVKAGKSLPDGRYLVSEIRRASDRAWTGGGPYVNLITKGVTEQFLEVTLEAYKREIGEQFGKRVLGSFTDEPQLRPAGGLPWCPDLPALFQQRWGYSLLEKLPSLTREIGDWQRVRHNYFSTLNTLFIERWAKPYHDWCERNGIAFTGHYWDHEWPNCVGVPDNMAMASWQQMPGIDCLMNQYAEHTHAQFGNLRFVRELASVANQMGRTRRLCEIYGAGGWDLRFVDMKRIADWLGVLGVNFFDEHLSYVTLRGARKRDHPQSFSYHEPWWSDYHVMADYLTRLSVAMSAGEQVNRIVVIEPTTTAWMYQGNGGKLGALGEGFFRFLQRLEAAQVEYDLVSEEVLARHGTVRRPAGSPSRLRVGQRKYHLLVLPPGAESLDSATVDFLSRTGSGFPVWCYGDPPSRVDGQPSDRFTRLVGSRDGWRKLAVDADPAELARALPFDGVRVKRAPGDAGILFHQRRRLADGDLLFLVNTSLEAPSRGEVVTTRRSAEAWDLFSGETSPRPMRRGERSSTLAFDLPPAGSLLVHLSDRAPARSAQSAPEAGVEQLTPASPITVRRLAPNVLTLDYVDVSVGNETRESVYFYDANRLIWQEHGMGRNPWDSAVQFKDELISKTFPADSGFRAHYRFTIEGAVPSDLAIVIERPDLYTITCNGRAVRATKGDWWLDKAFGRIPIAQASRSGENTVEITARPMSVYHELEPAYVLGSFSLKPAERGFIITPEQPRRWAPGKAEAVHGINPDGTMWLSGGIGFGKNAQGRTVEDRQPFLVFDLGRAVKLAGLRIWNYCEANVRDLTSRGVKELRVLTAREGGEWVEAGRFVLQRAAGPGRAEWLPLDLGAVRRVRLEPLSNHTGVAYPAKGTPLDNGFVGLAEVQFVVGDEPLSGVRVSAVSSELTSMGRTATHLLDRSGLTRARPGWKDQGLPFYAGPVAYEQIFQVGQKAGHYVLRLPDWNGSVARVRVNGEPAGHVVCPPWECDVTEQIQAGKNRVTIEVVGTLKNTLGPHHGNPGLGSAWPGSFQRGPNPGPPPGTNYSTVAYGLFEPPILEQR